MKEGAIPERQSRSAGLERESELLERVRAGDPDAMAELYDRFAPLVYSAAMRVLGDGAAAEDVLQEVFLQVWRRPGVFDARRGSLAAWLAVIARHRAIDLRRRQRPSTPLDEVVVALDAALDEAAARGQVVERVRAVLASMPAGQRRAVEMAFFEGLTHSEIAARTRQPLGTVKTRIRSALLAIRIVMPR